MLKLVAMNMYEIEENSSLECLVEFKKEYRRTVGADRPVPAKGAAGSV